MTADTAVLLFLSSANKAAIFGCWTITWTSPPVNCPEVEGWGVCIGKENFSSLGEVMRLDTM